MQAQSYSLSLTHTQTVVRAVISLQCWRRLAEDPSYTIYTWHFGRESSAQADDEAHADIYPLHTTHCLSFLFLLLCPTLSVCLPRISLAVVFSSFPALLKSASLMSFLSFYNPVLQSVFHYLFSAQTTRRCDRKKTHDRDTNANIQGCHVLCSGRSTKKKENEKKTTIQTDNLAHACLV